METIEIISNADLRTRTENLSLSVGVFERFLKTGKGGAETTLQLLQVSSTPPALLLNDSHRRAWVLIDHLPKELLAGDGFAILNVNNLSRADGSSRSASGVPIYLRARSVQLECWTDQDEEAIPLVSEINGDEPPMIEASLGAAITTTSASSAPTPLSPVSSSGKLTVRNILDMIPRALVGSFGGRSYRTRETLNETSSQWFSVMRLAQFVRRPAGTKFPHKLIFVDKTGSLTVKFWADDKVVMDEVTEGAIYALLGNGKLEISKYGNNPLEMLVSVASENAKKRVVATNQLTVAKIDESQHPEVLGLVPAADALPAAETSTQAARSLTCSEAATLVASNIPGTDRLMFDLPRAYLVSVGEDIQPAPGSSLSSRRMVVLSETPREDNSSIRLTVWGNDANANSLREIVPGQFDSMLQPAIPVSVTGLMIDFSKTKIDYRFKATQTCRFTRLSADTMDADASGGRLSIRDSVPDLMKLKESDMVPHDGRFSLLVFVPAVSEVRTIHTHKKVVLNLYDQTGVYTMTVWPNESIVAHIRKLPQCKKTPCALATLPDSIDPDLAERVLSKVQINTDDPDHNIFETHHSETPLLLISNAKMYISEAKNAAAGDTGRRYISTDAASKMIVVDPKLDDPDVKEMVKWYADHHTRFIAKLQPFVSKDLDNYSVSSSAQPSTASTTSSVSGFGSAFSRNSTRPLMHSLDSAASRDISNGAQVHSEMVVDQEEIERARRLAPKRSFVLTDDDDE